MPQPLTSMTTHNNLLMTDLGLFIAVGYLVLNLETKKIAKKNLLLLFKKYYFCIDLLKNK